MTIRKNESTGGKVLFISHNAGRNGAPLMLLNMLHWLKYNSNISFEILLRSAGPLLEEFAAIAPTSLYQTSRYQVRLTRYFAGGPKIKEFLANRHHRHLLEHFRRSGIDLIYSNTITNGDILKVLQPLGCRVTTHVHELEGWIQQAGQENLQHVMDSTSHFIAASQACKQNLIENHDISTEKIDVVHSFISVNKINANPAGIRKQLGIPDEAFVILGSGHEGWRKGKDLFVQLAAQMQKALPERKFHFIWVGGWLTEEDRRNVFHDVMRLGLANVVHFTGEVTNPCDYFAAGDVFTLVSREDTFPLVCLEAAALGKPILCFAGSGGMPEFVEDDAGDIIPYLDLDKMVERIVSLANDTETLARLGKRAAEKIREFYDLETGARTIESLIIKEFQFISGPDSAAKDREKSID